MDTNITSHHSGLAARLPGHIAAHPADLALDPPPSYMYIQDALIFVAALSWALAYLFWAMRTYRDRRSSMPLYVFPLNLSWELVYWIRLTDSRFESIAFSGWFLADLAFTIVTVQYGSNNKRVLLAQRFVLWTSVLAGCFWYLTGRWEDHQETAFWCGNSIMVAISWGKLYDLVRRGDTAGHSLEIWTMQFLGTTIFGFAVFFWRYFNIPQNWLYVMSWQSLMLMAASTVADVIYPVAYFRIKKKKGKAA